MVLRDIDKALEDIKEQYHWMEGTLESMMETLRQFNKDDEIQKVNRRIDEISHRSLKLLTDDEAAAIKEFKTLHYQKHVPHTKASGSTYIYKLTGTGIGTAITITCPVCGEEKDVTDYSAW